MMDRLKTLEQRIQFDVLMLRDCKGVESQITKKTLENVLNAIEQIKEEANE